MKATYFCLLLFIWDISVKAQKPVAVRSIPEAVFEIEKGKKVSLTLLDDQSTEFPKDFFKISKENLVALIIDGCKYKSIPKEISEYQELTYFRYSWFGFSKGPITNIPKGVFKLKKLKGLVFESIIERDISADISNLQNLELLELYRTKLKQFPKAILKLKKLKILNLSCAEFNEIPEEIIELKNLTKLQFDGGGCGATPINKIPESIGSLSNLKSISFGYVKGGLGYLPKSFFNLKKLEYFGCYGCGLKAFPPDLENLKELKSIQMMNMDDFGLLPESLFKLPNMKRFMLLIPGGKASKALVKQKKRLNIWGAKLDKYEVEIEHWEY
ncbi:leucine-rich repeat domain-containing protein [Tenacibaculum sp. ZS6-P6]|uniref:leucine-rich repeat domain-containing protein n=1 Tax=Tenacibaculum sp. ZS6-P6 TaxID=3447503 RepID=UPI003F9D4411